MCIIENDLDRILCLTEMEWVRGGLWLVGVFERWGSMTVSQADEWRRRIVARQRFLDLGNDPAD